MWKVWNLCLLVVVLAIVAKAEDGEDALEDVQTEFYLPYSTTEDVDFSLNKPGGFGCYQWSTDVEGVVALEPIFTDYDNLCGNRLEFRILKNNGKENISFKIKAENIDASSGYDNTEFPPVIEYTIHVRPLAKLEVLGLKTELTAGSDPVPFGVAGYDAEENEFDTLDGLQIGWYIGSKRDIAEFENYRQMGPIVKVKAIGAGKGAVIAVVSDPNYEKVEPAYLEFSVTASLVIEPDGAFLLEGGTAQLKLFEKSGVLNEEGKPTLRELKTTGEDRDYTFEVKETEYVTLDSKSNNVTAVTVGETTVFVKNSEGEIIKGMPIRVSKAGSVTVTAEPHSDSKQLILGHEYTIKVNVFTKEGRPIYPSENILCKTTFPRQFEILSVTENGLEAKVRVTSRGLGKVKANLRSVLNEEEEELEIIPHVKGSTDFEVYEQVTMKPKFTLLPWDENTKPNYTLNYKAEGGGQVFSYSVDNPEAATIDNEGHALSIPNGPVSFKVKVYMPKGDSNYDEADVHILPPTHVELEAPTTEFNTGGIWRGSVKFYTLLPITNEKAMYTDCSTVPYEVKLSDSENFEVESKSTLGNPQGAGYCAHFNIKAKPGVSSATTKVTISYLEPTSGRTLRSHATISAFASLSVLHPKVDQRNDRPKILLPVGSTTKLVLRGGPNPWPNQPSAHYKHMEVEDVNIAKVTHVGETKQEDGSYKPEHVYDVTCLKEGITEVSFIIGNSKSELNRRVSSEEKTIPVECGMPSKLTFKYAHVEEGTNFVHSAKHGKVLGNKDKDLALTFTLKDKDGRTFTNVDSLKIETKLSDETVLELQTAYPTIPQVELSQFAKINTKPRQVLKAKGKEGSVEIKAKLAGYHQDVLDRLGIQDAPPLPKVLDDDEDMDYEDEEDFLEHGHSLLEEIELHFTNAADLAALTPK